MGIAKIIDILILILFIQLSRIGIGGVIIIISDIFRVVILMELSPDIKKAFQSLTKTEEFIKNAAIYTKSAFKTIFSLAALSLQQHQWYCPSIYLLVLNHYITSNQSMDYIVECIQSESAQNEVMKVMKEFMIARKDELLPVDNTLYGNLSDIKWEMYIQNGREIWQVRLYTQERAEPFLLKLNYQQLSILTFKVSQIASQVASFDLDKIANS